MNSNLTELDQWPTLWSCHKKVRQYVQSMKEASREKLSPAVELSAIDAFLMNQVLTFYADRSILVDMSADATMGASIVFWESKPGISRIVCACSSRAQPNEDWRPWFSSALGQIDSSKSLCWVEPKPGNALCWDTVLHDLRQCYSLMFSFSASGPDVSTAANHLEWLCGLHNDTVGFIFPLGRIGGNGLLKAAVDFCSADSPYRLVALREVSPFLSSSEVGLVFRRSNPRIPLVLERIQQLYEGNFQFLKLIKSTTDAAVAEDTKSGQAIASRLILAMTRRVHLSYEHMLVLINIIPAPILKYVRSKLDK
jgi:hypothetical protein